MERWICTICQYVYDPALGDPDRGIAAGTPFASLPDDWTCPLCGAGKDVFEKE
jgi:rubredoxin